MTVTYSDRSFLRLLFRWRGSVWKDIWREYLVFLILYFSINCLYRFGLGEKDQIMFERTVVYFDTWMSRFPIQFLIGFYVSSIFARWWEQLNYVAWPDKFLLFVAANLQDLDAETTRIRKTFARYTNLLNVLVWKEICLKIKKRFPTDDHLLKAGLMTPKELEIFKETSAPFGRWFVPVSWMNNLLARCKAEGKISDFAHQKMVDELYAFRGASAMLTVFDWINIPLVYTQVVTLATYGYFAFNLIARQSTLVREGDKENIDLIFPLFTTLEFVFYIGWMKVGEDLRCPFGEDDEDFDMNFVLDRNIHVSNMLVDELHRQRPEPHEDVFAAKNPRLPHTMASWEVRDSVPNWRLAKYRIWDAKAQLRPMDGEDEGFLEAVLKDRSSPKRAKAEESLSEEESAQLKPALSKE